MHINQVAELIHRKVRHLSVEEALHRSNMRVCRYEVEEDAVLDCEVSTVRMVFPMIDLDPLARSEMNQPVDHLGAYPDGKLSRLLAVVFAVIFGD